MRRQADRPILITDARRSQSQQLHQRETRYVAMMLVRAGLLVLAVVLVIIGAPLLWLWLPMCAVGMLLIPWLAVLLANDRPPKEQYRFGSRLHREHHGPAPGSLPAVPTERIIEHDIEGEERSRRLPAG